jgi:RNA recognition motif-containing protein
VDCVWFCIQLRLRNAGGQPAPAFHAAPKAAPEVPAASAPPTPSSSTPAVGDAHNTFDENAPPEAEADVHSVYIKNLPSNIMPADVEKEFARFGSIKPGGVNVRSQKVIDHSILRIGKMIVSAKFNFLT